jgi:hypothetical protein
MRNKTKQNKTKHSENGTTEIVKSQDKKSFIPFYFRLFLFASTRVQLLTLLLHIPLLYLVSLLLYYFYSSSCVLTWACFETHAPPVEVALLYPDITAIT